jgi:transposase
MSKQPIIVPDRMFCGIDVSAVSLAVAIRKKINSSRNELGSTPSTFRYLDATDGIELAVLNPKVANRFAPTLRRSKADAADAQLLAEYGRQMPFTAWCAPNPDELRYVKSVATSKA